MKPIICSECQTPFKPVHNRQKTCGEVCAHTRKIRTNIAWRVNNKVAIKKKRLDEAAKLRADKVCLTDDCNEPITDTKRYCARCMENRYRKSRREYQARVRRKNNIPERVVDKEIDDSVLLSSQDRYRKWYKNRSNGNKDAAPSKIQADQEPFSGSKEPTAYDNYFARKQDRDNWIPYEVET